MNSLNFLNSAGFEEVEHTADWAYHVWGQNLTELFIQAAIALYTLADVRLTSESSIKRKIQLQGVDHRESSGFSMAYAAEFSGSVWYTKLYTTPSLRYCSQYGQN
ncbi:archease [Halotia wernerae UHCC 0503]|nr:archease [Halotia wernerae UHCC 0503]